MADLWMDVDAALSEVPVNLMPLIDDTDFKTREESVTYDQAGLDLVWNFITPAGAMTQTAVTPTDTAGAYDWVNQGNGMYTIEIPATGGGSINNDTEGFGWFTGFATGILPWRGPVIGFRASGLNDALVESAYSATRGLAGTALPAAAADAAGGLPISDAGALDLDAQAASVAAIETDTSTTLDNLVDDLESRLGTPSDLGSGATVAANLADIKTETAAILDDTDLIDDGTSGLAKIATDVAAVLVDTAEIGAAGAGLTEAGGTGDQLTAVPWNAAWDAEVQSEAADALTAYDPPTRAELTSDIASVLAVLQGLVLVNGTIGATGNDATTLHLDGLTYGDDEINNYLLVVFDVSESEYHARWIEDWATTGDLATVATLPFTPQASTDTYWLLPVRQDVTGGSGLDAAGVRAAVGLASANLDTQLSAIDTVVDGIKAVTDNLPDSGALNDLAAILLDTAEIGTAGAGLTAVPWNAAWDAEVQSEAADALTAYDPPTRAELTTDIGTVTTAISGLNDPTAAAVADAVWDEAKAGHVGAGSFGEEVQAHALSSEVATVDSNVDAIKAVTDLLPDAGALTTLVNNVAAILTDTGTTLPATLATIAGYIDTEVAAILEDTGTTIPALIAALENLSAAEVNAEVVDVLRTDLIPDAVNTAGTMPTIAQAIYLIMQALIDHGVSGTTDTIRAIDGVTGLATLTLDDGTSPTDVTRAT